MRPCYQWVSAGWIQVKFDKIRQTMVVSAHKRQQEQTMTTQEGGDFEKVRGAEAIGRVIGEIFAARLRASPKAVNPGLERRGNSGDYARAPARALRKENPRRLNATNRDHRKEKPRDAWRRRRGCDESNVQCRE
jgi:hypothetical protein